MAHAVPRPAAPSTERRFFFGMALFLLCVMLAGFAPSYYLRGIAPAPHPYAPLTPMVHLHGIVFSCWMLLFVVQAGLVSAGRVDLHRRLGLAGVGMVALMIPLGIVTGLNGVHRPMTAPPGIDPLSWAALSLFDVPVYGGLIIAGLLARRSAGVHKRLMLLAMIVVVQPGAARILSFGLLPPQAVGPAAGIFVLAMLLALIGWDIVSRRRPHPATLAGGALVALRIIVVPIVWTTPAWMNFVRWAAGPG